MSDATIKITSRKKECLDEFESSVEKALEMIGLIAERYAKELVRKDTGRLQNSITHATAEGDTVYIGTNVEYAPYIELGTSRNHGPYPFLRPAAENHADEYKKIIESELKG